MDLWLLNHKTEFDKERRDALLAQSGLAEFAAQSVALSEKWFSEQSDKIVSSEFEDYIFRGGLYGSLEHNVALRKSRHKNRFSYYLKRVFLPYKSMKYTYPSLKKCPVLLPVFWVVRWCKLLNPAVRRRARTEIKTEQSVSPGDRARIESLMDQLGL